MEAIKSSQLVRTCTNPWIYNVLLNLSEKNELIVWYNFRLDRRTKLPNRAVELTEWIQGISEKPCYNVKKLLVTHHRNQ